MLEHQKGAAAGVETGVELQLERVTEVRFWVFMRTLRGKMQSPEKGRFSRDASETSERAGRMWPKYEEEKNPTDECAKILLVLII